MKSKMKWLISLMIGLLITGTLSACGSEKKQSGTGEKDISGNITVITQRTDIVDTVFQKYAEKFQEKYPNVKVSFEALADYGGQITPRMNTKDYGDVLLIPTQVPIADIPDYFEPLGSLKDMEKKYMGVEERAVDGKVYGIPIAVTYTGIVYNKKVFEKAGIKKLPRTFNDLMEALKKVKNSTDAVPLYTNYASGWPLTQWEGVITTVAGDPDYYNVKMVNENDPFAKGKPHYQTYKLMYDLAKQGLIEKDPLTTDWESSKAMLGRGEIATMVMGSWAVDQIKGVAENPDDIGFMPFPTNADKVIFPLGADFQIAINKNSENKEAARAWVDWFIHESDYSVKQAGGISAAKDKPLPDELQHYKKEGVEFKLLTPAKEGQKGLMDKIDKEAEIGFWLEKNKKTIVEAGIGNRSESFDQLAEQYNKAWNKARTKIMKK
ncbi:extracellular solute-binding protein [Bacillus sp. WMMC1349]|uniref:ABC transporter substrate-binding protein n=1 Tax=Bacillus sp. WMMC1349 TaxID=2736254 RepID=UPI00155713FB|nr:extracellular solute-binding protein [Bacillus sp. WMMC1349]NPC93485.1 extracellular solute-binding protein [Bacillus sp. WMMC1349]